MNLNQIRVLKDIESTLSLVVRDKSEIYEHQTNDVKYLVNREEHLEGIIEWAIDQLGQNFDLE
ncbi:hypothetical protein CD117_04280 [Mammaliicoccus sciuri]|uniref:Pathogenicity island protein n=1 Tax=Mammaliicoccus sciuri TaxID=1296 RepID=A0AAJ4SIQ7_MAMSC|nr:hypothetical protein [Mammaliicoccus sciuri]RTX73812.1 hypothetical protein CD117_04280 [Mammaliicoccus sciuri]